MANETFNDLATLTGGAVAAGDKFPMFDLSANVSKGMIPAELAIAIINAVVAGGIPVAKIAAQPIEVEVSFYGPDVAWVAGDNVAHFTVPASLNGKVLTAVVLQVDTPSTSGKPTVQVRNITNANADMLTTPVTCDINETTSTTAAVPAVIDPAHQDVASYNTIAIDVEVAGAGTGTTGGRLILTFA